MKKLLAGLCAMLVITGVLSGCSLGGSNKPEDDSNLANQAFLEGITQSLSGEQIKGFSDLFAADAAAVTHPWLSFADLASGKDIDLGPLKFRKTANGFALLAQHNENSILGKLAAFGDWFEIHLEATEMQLVSIDELSLVLRFADATGYLGELTVLAGSPVVTYRALRNQPVLLGETYDLAAGKNSGVWVAQEAFSRFGLSSSATISGHTVGLKSGQTLTLVALPNNKSSQGEVLDLLIDYPAFVSAKVSLNAQGEKVFKTFDFASEKDTKTNRYLTFFTVLRGTDLDLVKNGSCNYGEYKLAQKTLILCLATGISFEYERAPEPDFRQLKGVKPASLTALRKALKADYGDYEQKVATAAAESEKMVFTLSDFAKYARLAQLAQVLAEPEIAADLVATLQSQLVAWAKVCATDPAASGCFVYDDDARLLYQEEPVSNLQLFESTNLLLAASVAFDETQLAEEAQLQEYLDLISRNLLAGPEDALFPQARLADFYADRTATFWGQDIPEDKVAIYQVNATKAWDNCVLWAQAFGDEPELLLAQYLQTIAHQDLNATPGSVVPVVAEDQSETELLARKVLAN